MKADMSALKEQMASLMEAMLGMRQLMEKNVATAIAVSSAAEADPTLLATAHHPPPNAVGREKSTQGHNNNTHLGYNRVAYPYGLPPNYMPLVMHDDAGQSLPPSLKGSLLDSPTRSMKIIESMPKGMSMSTPRSPSRGRHPTHCLSITSQHNQYSCPQKDHPRRPKKEGNSISSRRD